jgi:dUTP pyrophosphatase
MIKVNKIVDQISYPEYKTEGASGFDLESAEILEIAPGEFKAISTGLSFEIPLGYEMQIRPRSGLAAKHGITVLNAPGTIDSDYRGEVKVILVNHSKETFYISLGDRIAQGVITKVYKCNLMPSKVLSETERGNKGFGSTGI